MRAVVCATAHLVFERPTFPGLRESLPWGVLSLVILVCCGHEECQNIERALELVYSIEEVYCYSNVTEEYDNRFAKQVSRYFFESFCNFYITPSTMLLCV